MKEPSAAILLEVLGGELMGRGGSDLLDQPLNIPGAIMAIIPKVEGDLGEEPSRKE